MMDAKPWSLRYLAVVSDVLNATRDIQTIVELYNGTIPNQVRKDVEPERFTLAEHGAVIAALTRLNDAVSALRERRLELRDEIDKITDAGKHVVGRIGHASGGVEPPFDSGH